jgi:hypothetical protein
MKQLLISSEAEQELLRIAENDGIWAQREVARLYVHLEHLEKTLARTSQFWNIQDAASGSLESCATLKDGTSIWRLCPTHVHCIALLVEQNGDLLVLEVCSRAEVETTENHLINCC